jgi:hypothetical protein
MGVYAFTLAGSNYFTPVLCGFIAEGQGWQWVFYWPAIWLAAVFIFLFFFMEETNYSRKTTGIVADLDTPPSEPAQESDSEKQPKTVLSSPTTEYAPPKTFVQKLAIWRVQPGQSMIQRAYRSLYVSLPDPPIPRSSPNCQPARSGRHCGQISLARPSHQSQASHLMLIRCHCCYSKRGLGNKR